MEAIRKQYDRTYRERHPEKVREQRLACYLKYHQENLEKKRIRYAANKEKISAQNKADVKICPICHINYKRRYLPTHLLNRHNVTPDDPVVT